MNRWCGSILEAVVKAVKSPVTLKMRTGWDPDHRNGVAIARMAEAIGVQALAVHGRTRACMYQGNAEYETIRTIKQSVTIPVFANGDIDSPRKAKFVLEQTGADGLMVGRSAQGRPWIFREIAAYLRDGSVTPEPSIEEVRDIMLAHLRDLHAFYGEEAGVRVARKHIDWYAKGRPAGHAFRHAVMQAEDAQTQLASARAYFDAVAEAGDKWKARLDSDLDGRCRGNTGIPCNRTRSDPVRDMAPRKKTRARREPIARPPARSMPLRTMTAEALDSYFATLNGHKPGQLYDLVLREVEEPLFKAVLDYAEGNQSRAADILGINRGTLRKKLKTYGLAN